MSLFLLQDPITNNFICYTEEEVKMMDDKNPIPYNLLRRVETENDLRRCMQSVEHRMEIDIQDVGPGVPNEFKGVAQNCANNLSWQKGELLGQGTYGSAYVGCKCDYVLKIQLPTKDFYNEVQALTELQLSGVVPKLYAAWICDGTGYLVIEKLTKCQNIPDEKLYKQIYKALEKLYVRNWLHVDVHPDNIMCRGNQVVLIDFGWAVKNTDGDKEQLYPEHPLSIKYKKSMPWYLLQIVQMANLVENFPVKTGNRVEEFKQYKEQVLQELDENWQYFMQDQDMVPQPSFERIQDNIQFNL